MVSFQYLREHFEGKKVFLTGHTGFKGTWMLQVLARLGAIVKGYALNPAHSFDLYHLINGDELCQDSIIHDIRDAQKVKDEILVFQPDFIFHLAAQPLVLQGYQEPLYTFEVNTQGTANLLDAVRFLEKDCVVVVITTDKVYENNDSGKSFKEEDKLGGFDPYSASKAACEIIISSYRSSYFSKKAEGEWVKPLASVRAGNVIGGGDFAENRIIPDIINSIRLNKIIELRNPHAIRPWQHVLEPIGAYLTLACNMVNDPFKYDKAYNIGPKVGDNLTVEELTQLAIEIAGKGSYTVIENKEKPHEAATLLLDIDRIKNLLQWEPKYDSHTAILKTVQWYLDTSHADLKCQSQINEYFEASIQNSNES